MKDQVHIRNAEAAQLARMLARQTGKTISDVVLEALRQYRPTAVRFRLGYNLRAFVKAAMPVLIVMVGLDPAIRGPRHDGCRCRKMCGSPGQAR